MKLKFKVGDVCMTQNSSCPQINDGLIVVIVDVNSHVQAFRGAPAPYLIRRIDGQPYPNTVDRTTGAPNWYRATQAWCEEYKLRKSCDADPSVFESTTVSAGISPTEQPADQTLEVQS